MLPPSSGEKMQAADSYKMLYQLVNLDSAIYSFKWQFKLIREGEQTEQANMDASGKKNKCFYQIQ
jgi:hypothetical protein